MPWKYRHIFISAFMLVAILLISVSYAQDTLVQHDTALAYVFFTNSTSSKNLSKVLIVYGSASCPACAGLKKFLEENNIPYVFRELAESKEYVYQFMNITKLCGLDAYIPLTVVVNSQGNITAIVQGGVFNVTFWDRLLNARYDYIEIYYVENKVGTVSDPYVVSKIYEAVFGKTIMVYKRGESVEKIIPLLVTLGLFDSINPCAISTTLLLSLTAASIGFKERKSIPPLVFTCGVYLGYFIVGLVTSILLYSTLVMMMICILIFVIIFKDMYTYIKRRGSVFECRDRECLPKYLTGKKGKLALFSIFSFGVAVSWSFMMCSAAPYFVFLTMLATNIANYITRVLLIAIYCLIVIIPLIIVSISSKLIPANLVSGRTLMIIRDIILLIIASYIIYNLITYYFA